MATPAGDSYSGASGGVIAGGRYRLPAWLRVLAVGQWSEATGSALGSSSALFNWGGASVGSQSSVVEGWGSWAVDYVNKKIYVQGGGHSDYGGNEIYCLDLVSMAWSRIVDPTSMANATRFINSSVHSKWNSDGTPVASHSYWNAHVINGVILRSPFFSDFGQTLSGTHAFAPNNDGRLHGFNTITGQWDSPTDRALLPNFSPSDLNSGGISYGPCVAHNGYYYAVLNNVAGGYTKLHRYDPTANTWTGLGSDLGPYVNQMANGTYPGSILDTLRGEIVRVGEGSDNFVRRFDLTTGAKTDSAKTGITFAATWDSSYTGCCYDSKRDKYYLYSGQAVTDKSVYVCDPANSYEMSIMAGTGTPSPTTPAAGLNSRFKYITEWDCVLMQPTFAAPIQVLRLS